MTKRHATSPEWMEKQQRWRMRVQRDGVRKAFYSSVPGRKGMLECREKADRWLNGNQASGNPLIKDVYNEWLEEVKELSGMSSYRKNSDIGKNHILPVIGNLHVDRMTNEQMFQRIINESYRTKPGRTGEKLSQQTLRNIRSTITGFLKYCRKCGYTTVHPENLAIPKSARKPHKRILQPEDLRILFSQEDREWFQNAFRFAVLTGLRPGELLGLQWNDIQNGIVHIRRAINYHSETTEGKNLNAQRTFYLPEKARTVLVDQREMLRTNGVHSEYVFPGTDGEPPTQRALEGRLTRMCNRLGITPVTPYELRHTFFSVNKTLPAELVKQMGGHSESMDTFGVYGHAVDGEMQLTAKLMDGVLNGILGPEDADDDT